MNCLMRVPQLRHLVHLKLVLSLIAAIVAGTSTGRANVFASQIRLAGTTTNLQITAGQAFNISYRLNQEANLGVTVSICIGTNVAWSTNLAGGSMGTHTGTNTLTWPGKDSLGNNLTNGNWSVAVLARAAGPTNWASIPLVHNYVYSSQGLAVNNNTNSLHFGRIFIGNALTGTGSDPADAVGITKYYADGSYVAEGTFSTGGWAWTGNDSSPWKIEVGQDDRVYVVDGASRCTVLSFDQFISTNTPVTQALQTNSLVHPSVNYAGVAITGAGATRQLYLTDIDAGGPNGVGVRRWDMASGVVASNDFGITVVAASNNVPLELFPQDVALDSSNRIFVVQKLAPSNLETNRVLAYPAYSGTPLTAPLWSVTLTNLSDAFGIAAALHTNFVAVVCRSSASLPISIFNTDTGTRIVADELNAGSPDYTDVAWDRAGNLYVTDWIGSVWAAFSPPGTNQFQSVSVQTIKVGPFSRPSLLAPQFAGGQFQTALVGEAGVSYAFEVSTNLPNWTPVTTNRAYAVTNIWQIPAPSGQALVRARVVH